MRYANKEDKGAAFANFKPQKYDRACMKENLQRIGAATYVIERVFAGGRTPQEAVAEEIITTAKKGDFFDHSGNKVI